MTTIYETLCNHMSLARVNSYKQLAKSCCEEDAVKLYCFNHAMSLFMWHNISIFEVVFRNYINEELKHKYGQKWYLDNNFRNDVDVPNTHTNYSNIEKELQHIKHSNDILDVLVSRLTFVQWYHIGKNTKILLKTQNQYLKKHKDFYEIIHKILKLRNRLSHQENIIKDQKNLIFVYGKVKVILSEIIGKEKYDELLNRLELIIVRENINKSLKKIMFNYLLDNIKKLTA